MDCSSSKLSIAFDLNTRLIYPNARTGQDTLAVMRGPIVFVAEDVDNSSLESSLPHFELVGLSESAQFEEVEDSFAGISTLRIITKDVYTLDQTQGFTNRANGASKGIVTTLPAVPLYGAVKPGTPVRSWTRYSEPLILVPWFARGNRGGKGHLRTPFMRVGTDRIR